MFLNFIHLNFYPKMIHKLNRKTYFNFEFFSLSLNMAEGIDLKIFNQLYSMDFALSDFHSLHIYNFQKPRIRSYFYREVKNVTITGMLWELTKAYKNSSRLEKCLYQWQLCKILIIRMYEIC